MSDIRFKYDAGQSLSMLCQSLLFGLASLALLPQQASSGMIFMPEGSNVWMEFQSSAATGGSDVAGSNQAGAAPPNGIPLTTVFSGTRSASGFAEITAMTVRTYAQGSGVPNAFVFASMNDTYTVGGAGSGPIAITFEVNYHGLLSSYMIDSGTHILTGYGQIVEIGVFNHDPNLSDEFVRVRDFGGDTRAFFGGSTIVRGAAFDIPWDVTARYTRMVNVGDTFNLGIGFTSQVVQGTADARNTGTINITGLPEGVFITSLLGGQWGDTGTAEPVPEPASLTLLASGAVCAAGAGWRRRRRAS